VRAGWTRAAHAARRQQDAHAAIGNPASVGYVHPLKAAPSDGDEDCGPAAVAAMPTTTSSALPRYMRHDGARFCGAGFAPTGRPQNETSPFPQRKRLAAEDAWPERAATRVLLFIRAQQRPGGTAPNIPHDPPTDHPSEPGKPPASPVTLTREAIVHGACTHFSILRSQLNTGQGYAPVPKSLRLPRRACAARDTACNTAQRTIDTRVPLLYCAVDCCPRHILTMVWVTGTCSVCTGSADRRLLCDLRFALRWYSLRLRYLSWWFPHAAACQMNSRSRRRPRASK
jgi:hypothetical protein